MTARLDRARLARLHGCGLLLTVGASTVLLLVRQGSAQMFTALGLVAVGGAVSGPLGAPLAVVPGALVLAFGTHVPGMRYAEVLVFLVVVVGGALVASADDRLVRVGPVLLAITFAGVFETVPDTEQAVVVLGVAVALAGLSWFIPSIRLGRSGSFAACAMLAWIATRGGAGRPGAVVGAVACLGVLAIEPCARVGRRISLGTAEPKWAARPIAAHVVVVSLAARGAGMRTGATQAVVLAAPLIAAACVAMIAVPLRGTT